MKQKKIKPSKPYYLPHSTHWPIIGSLALFCLATSVVSFVHQGCLSPYLFIAGALLLAFMMFGWFGSVINESMSGLYNRQMDRTYRWGMFWFITSELAFFAIFFGALFYTRYYSVPRLGGQIGFPETHQLLWPAFQSMWPLLKNPNPTLFPGAKQAMEAWGIPALNTFILLSSAVMITWAHWGLEKRSQRQLIIGTLLTILLGLTFLGLQIHEYRLAYLNYDLTLHSGIYGATFFMLTGFHGAHVTIGLIMLFVILIRCIKGHFNREHDFAFEAVSWYWHFVDVIWLFLFVFVYWL